MIVSPKRRREKRIPIDDTISETKYGTCLNHIFRDVRTVGGGIAQDNRLIEGIAVEQLLADHGYDSDDIVNQANLQGMKEVIPPRKNRKKPLEYDLDLYKLRHLVENAFLHVKRWRGIATRYAKNSASFLAAVHIRCIALWARIS